MKITRAMLDELTAQAQAPATDEAVFSGVFLVRVL